MRITFSCLGTVRRFCQTSSFLSSLPTGRLRTTNADSLDVKPRQDSGKSYARKDLHAFQAIGRTLLWSALLIKKNKVKVIPRYISSSTTDDAYSQICIRTRSLSILANGELPKTMAFLSKIHHTSSANVETQHRGYVKRNGEYKNTNLDNLNTKRIKSHVL